MAETVIYEFTIRNASPALPWETTPANMVNGIKTDYAETNNDGETEELTENDCPGDDLGEISKVELRVYAYGDANDRIDITPYFDGVSAGDEHQLTPGTLTGWKAWQDITNDPNAPDWSFWSYVQDLDVHIEYDSVAGKGVMHCGLVQIQVTYATVGPPAISGTITVTVQPTTITAIGVYTPQAIVGTLTLTTQLVQVTIISKQIFVGSSSIASQPAQVAVAAKLTFVATSDIASQAAQITATGIYTPLAGHLYASCYHWHRSSRWRI